MPIYRDNTYATTEQQDLLIYIGPDMPCFLIVPGDANRTVPLNQSQFLYRALRIAGLDAMPVERFRREAASVHQLAVALDGERLVIEARDAPAWLEEDIRSLEAELGRPLHASQVIAELQAVDGVDGVACRTIGIERGVPTHVGAS